MPIRRNRQRHAEQSPLEADTHVADHTVSLRNLAEQRGDINPATGNYQGREIITRDTGDPEGMVDIRSTKSAEAIVVDSNGEFGPLYQELLDQRDEEFKKLHLDGESNERVILEALHNTVMNNMVYDLDFVNEYSEKTKRDGDKGGQKVNLGFYLMEGKGVCRHMALAISWLGARTAEQGYLSNPGTFTAEVNQRVSDNAAHEWRQCSDLLTHCQHHCSNDRSNGTIFQDDFQSSHLRQTLG